MEVVVTEAVVPDVDKDPSFPPPMVLVAADACDDLVASDIVFQGPILSSPGPLGWRECLYRLSVGERGLCAC